MGGQCETRLRLDRACKEPYVRRQLNLIPAGIETWVYSAGVTYFRQFTLAFDLEYLVEHLLEQSGSRFVLEPQLRVSDAHAWGLAQMLAAECENSGHLGQLYGDSLVLALVIRVLRLQRSETGAKRGGLTRTQLARAREFLKENLAMQVSLSDLASLTGLSQSHFCHAFKVSTGEAPHRWLLTERIRRSKELIVSGLPLADVAAATGFADQSHFTRVFRKQVGTTPRAWHRAHLG